MKMTDDEMVALAIREGVHPETVEVGQVYERAPMLCRDGKRFELTTRGDHERIRITAIPGRRRRRISYVKIAPRRMGNGRADRGEHRIDRIGLVRHYALVDVTPDPPPANSAP